MRPSRVTQPAHTCEGPAQGTRPRTPGSQDLTAVVTWPIACSRRGAMRCLLAATTAVAIGVSAPALADSRLPIMSPREVVHCASDVEGLVWRIQCDPANKICLYAPNDELDSDGDRVKPLERARACELEMPFDRAKLEADGYVFVPGRVDAPWGWTRDERGRVFQINFDLRKRMYFGVGYTPRKVLENPLESTRTSIDFGLLSIDLHGKGSKNRHRFRFVRGEVRMEPFSAEMVVAHYDMSRRFTNPLVRITTFVGEPARHDLHLNVGMWSEVGGLEIHKTELGHSQLWRHAQAQITFDLWQSANLDSFLRLRTGMGLEGQHTDVTGYRSALVSGSALELDTVLDHEGRHNLRAEVTHDIPRYFVPLEYTGKVAHRTKARVQYEAVLVAINDQPVTLKLAAGGEKRDDIPGIPSQWAFVMDAGVRFSLWAPPRPR